MKISNFILLALSLFLVSCGLIQKGQKSNEQPKIRIVDLQGKAHQINTKVPELNARAMALQGSSTGTSASVPTNKFAEEVKQKSPQAGEVKYQNYQEQNLANAQATSSFPQATQPAAPIPDSTNNETDLTQGGSKQKEQVVEYDLDESKTGKTQEKLLAKSNKKFIYKKSKTNDLGSKFFVQVGSFSSNASAESMLSKMKKFHSGKVVEVEGDKTIYRALLGPLANKTKANELAKKITRSGHDAIVIKAE